MVQNPNTQNTKTEAGSWIIVFVLLLYIILLFFPSFWMKPTNTQWEIVKTIVILQYLAWFLTIIFAVAFVFGMDGGVKTDSVLSNFVRRTKLGTERMTFFISYYSQVLKSLNQMINWKAIRETLGFGFVFGIFSNLFYPQILNFSIGEISPLVWLKFDHNSKPLFLQISKYWDKEIFVEMLKSGTINLIVICATILIIAFIGGSKMLNVLVDYVATKTK